MDVSVVYHAVASTHTTTLWRKYFLVAIVPQTTSHEVGEHQFPWCLPLPPKHGYWRHRLSESSALPKTVAISIFLFALRLVSDYPWAETAGCLGILPSQETQQGQCVAWLFFFFPLAIGSLGCTAASKMELDGRLEKDRNNTYWKASRWGLTW